jgi:hypothetical protein
MKRVALLISLLICTPVLAHDAEHPELNDWMRGLINKRKGQCCDGTDAVHLRDVDWKSQNKPESHYKVRIPMTSDGNNVEWVDVPDDAVVDGPNKDGSTLVWPIYGPHGAIIQCFIMGAQG